MATSQAWNDFLANLREATTLLRADPTSAYVKRRAAADEVAPPPPSISLTNATNKGCVLLLSGRLQGFVAALLEEFLERLDQSGVLVDQIPEKLRAELCRCYYDKPDPNAHQTMLAHKQYAVLWTPGVALPAGTLKTNSLGDDANPWPHIVQGLMRRCGVDLYAQIVAAHSTAYLTDLEEYVGELVRFRNSVAHGDEPTGTWTAADVRLRMRWATRLARACDTALGAQLQAITGDGW